MHIRKWHTETRYFVHWKGKADYRACHVGSGSKSDLCSEPKRWTVIDSDLVSFSWGHACTLQSLSQLPDLCPPQPRSLGWNPQAWQGVPYQPDKPSPKTSSIRPQMHWGFSTSTRSPCSVHLRYAGLSCERHPGGEKGRDPGAICPSASRRTRLSMPYLVASLNHCPQV